MKFNVMAIIFYFKAPNCGQPPSPGVNGLVTYNSTLLGANADYICNNGYQLSPPGMEQRFCLLSGKWSGVDLTCEGKDFGVLYIRVNEWRMLVLIIYL